MAEREKRYLESIFFNLLLNAIKYSHKDGKNVIRIEGKTDPVRGYILFRIVNDGIGVPEGEEDAIFDKCVRGSNSRQASPPGGSGYGLFISRLLAEMLGGYLILNSRDAPTEFELGIPDQLAIASAPNGGGQDAG